METEIIRLTLQIVNMIDLEIIYQPVAQFLLTIFLLYTYKKALDVLKRKLSLSIQ